MGSIYGREADWPVLESFLDRAAARAQALVLEGAAGIGKSTLWTGAVEAARERGFVVLTSRPAEAERRLANVVLGDLLREVQPDDLAALSGPRRRAFESALLVREDPDFSPDSRTLGVAVVDLLPVLANGAPLLVAIDDDQWMDPSSAATLAFALRRVEDAPVSLLLARRATEAPPAALEESLGADAMVRLTLQPLSLGALHALIRERLGIVLSRPTQVWLHDVSGGNAFHALEVARTIPAGTAPSGAGGASSLPVPGRLDRLLDARLGSLDAASQDALLLVAAQGRMPRAMLRAASISGAAIDSARQAGVLEIVDGVARFTHPLLASTIYERATDEERRAAHQRLARVVDDDLHRARHLALGAPGPGRELADALESAVQLATERGASVAAAELADHALRLTPPEIDGDRRRRAGAAARAHSAAGDGPTARRIAAELLLQSEPGPARAEALLLGAGFETPGSAIEILKKALTEARGSPEVEARVHAALAENVYFAFGERDAADIHAAAAVRMADALGDDALQADAMSIRSITRFAPGHLDALELAERAYRLAEGLDDLSLLKRVGDRLVHVLAWVGDMERSRAFLEAWLTRWEERDELARETALWYLALVEFWSGRWDAARDHAAESMQITADYRPPTPPDFFPAALIALHRGDLEAARRLAERGLAAADAQALLDSYFGILGACDLWSGDAEAALANFRRAEESADVQGTREPGMREWRREQVEALLQLGHDDEAAALAGDWEAQARSVNRDRVVAQTVYCRGLVAAARGRGPEAIQLLEAAVNLHERVGDPYGMARSQLALGINRRRARQKATAREAMEAALAGFEALGAAYWAAVARRELSRIGGRSRVTGLSPAELSVATLAAQGQTNREIAATLFLGERTVASHLSHSYAKLGVRSRTELARQLAAPAAMPADRPTTDLSARSVSKVPSS